MQNNTFSLRTDLAIEYSNYKNVNKTSTTNTTSTAKGISSEKSMVGECQITHIKIDKEGERLYKKQAGNYYTLHCEENFSHTSHEEQALKKCLSDILPKGKALVVGLGNREITPDSLGIKSANKVLATAHLKEHEDFSALGLREVFVLSTNVLAQTGIESTNHIKAISRETGADFIIAIDALACSDLNRLTSTIQLTDTGISPGSGVGNMRKALSLDALGIPCYAIGVPMVIDLNSLCKGDDDDNIADSLRENMMVTPRNIDAVVNRYSDIIANAINSSLNPTLSQDEIELLLAMGV